MEKCIEMLKVNCDNKTRIEISWGFALPLKQLDRPAI